jgi:hypothetical protein
MVMSKKKFERLAHEEGVVIKGYHAELQAPQLDVVGGAQVQNVPAPPLPPVVEDVVEPVPVVVEPVAVVPVAVIPAVPVANPVPPVLPGRRNAGRNKKYFEDEWVNYQTGSSSTGSSQKRRASILDHQYIQSLDWQKTLDQIKSKDLSYFIGQIDVYIDYKESTVEWMHPHSLAAIANAEDNPT